MKGLLAWIIFALASLTCLFWIGFGVRDDLREDDVFHDIIQERIDLANNPGEELHVGVVGDWARHESILKGVSVAAEDINEDGGILGRKIVLDSQDDKGTVDGALGVAQVFATNPEIAFVLGHTQLNLNAAVAQNYEFYGLLCLSPNIAGGSSGDNFSRHFENGTPPYQIGGAILNLAKEKKWTRIGLLYEKSDHALRQARRFESMANKHGIQMPLSFAYEGRGSGVAMHMERWKRELGLDAIVLAVDDSDVIPLISACRVLEIDCPIIVLGERPAVTSSQAEEMLGAMYFLEPYHGDAAFHDFSKRFRDKFTDAPNADALLGYDSLLILAGAIRKADSFVPDAVAAALKDSPIEDSLSGSLRFDQKGSAIKRPPHFISY